MADKQQFVSMAPEDFVKGGLLDDVDVEVTEAIYKVWDYDANDEGKGSSGLSTLALKLTMKDMDSGETSFQFWSAGDPAHFGIVDADGEISSEGVALIPTGSKSGVNDSTNIYHLMNSFAQNGFPTDKLRNFRSDLLHGLQMHVTRVPAPKRSGLKSEPVQEGREKTILVCSKIIKLPWEKNKKKGAAKKATKRTGSSTPADTSSTDDGDDAEQAVATVKAVIEDAGGLIEHSGLKLAVLKYMAKAKSIAAANRNTLAKQIITEEWLLENGFMLDEGNVTEA